MSQDDINRQAFLEEANELLAELETALLELEETPDDSELVDRVFRAMHTIKGSGAMFGFDDVAHFTHDVETVFDMVREGKIPVTKELLDLTLGARDHILELLEDGSAAGSAQAPGHHRRTARAVRSRRRGWARGPPPLRRPSMRNRGDSLTYRVRFKPETGIFSSGTNPLSLIDELTEMGMHQVVAHTSGIPPLSELDPEDCHVWWDVVLATDKGEDAIRDVFIFVEDDCEVKIQVIDSLGALDTDASYKRLGEILVERGDLTQDDLKNVLGEQKRLGDLLTDAGVVSDEQIQSALAEQQARAHHAQDQERSGRRLQHPCLCGQAGLSGGPGGRVGHRPGPDHPGGRGKGRPGLHHLVRGVGAAH